MGMNIKVNPDQLDQAVINALNDWSSEARTQINLAVRETAQDVAKMLRGGGPYHNRTGSYTSGWEAKLDTRSYRASLFHTETWTVWNKTDYRLTHLLEFGHALRRGGRTYGHVGSFPHIADKEDIAGDLLAMKIAQKLNGII